MKKLLFAAATLLAVFISAKADTDYLLVQGPFGSGGALQNFEWKLTSGSASTLNGLNLLDAVFGAPVLTGSYQDSFNRTYPYYTATNGSQGIGYIFSFGSYFVESFTLGGVKVAQTTSYDPSWNYSVAGGSGSGHGGTYSSGSWSLSDDGGGTRTEADGSFDAYVFGSYPATVVGVNPTASDFSGATPVSVPEASSAIFGLIGLAVLWSCAKCFAPRHSP